MSQLVQKKNFRGVFIQRRLNLNYESYDVKAETKIVVYKLKKILTLLVKKQLESVIQIYIKENMQDIYGKIYIHEAMEEITFQRQIYEMIIDLQITTESKSGIQKVFGGEGPTRHLVQI